METYRLDGVENLARNVEKAAEILRNGGVILYPTDTLYGLGADAFSDEAVAKIYAIKGRDEGKPMHAMVADLAMAEEYGEINETARKLAEKFLPGPLTLILKKKEGVNSGIARGLDTVGIRIVDNPFCLELCRAFGKPITATSANRSGEKPERSIEKILNQLNDVNFHSNVLQNTRIGNIDVVIDAGELPARLPSTVVDVSSGEAIILREGAISAKQIMDALSV